MPAEEIALIEKWWEAGAARGAPEHRPEPPTWTEGWQLGEPDLIVEPDEAYTLAAEGTDVFRNFVF